MADKRDLREVVDAAIEAKVGKEVERAIERKRARIAGIVLNTRFPTGVGRLDSRAGGGGRHIPWFLRDIRRKLGAIQQTQVLLAKSLEGATDEVIRQIEALAKQVEELPGEIDDVLIIEDELEE